MLPTIVTTRLSEYASILMCAETVVANHLCSILFYKYVSCAIMLTKHKWIFALKMVYTGGFLVTVPL